MKSNSRASLSFLRLGSHRANTIATSLVTAVLVVAFGWVPALQGGQEKASPGDDTERQFKVLQQAMDMKLKHTHELITCLAVEDFEKLGKNAEALKRIGRDTLWKVSPSVAYIKYSTEFTAISDELARCAKEKDLNGATLAYVRLTINCVDCHKYVRNDRILDPKLRRR